ncbi:MAG: N-acetylneuraminate synthase family protein [Elusimicrobia bacterium]|nr:N-acetylneuraminate synthase family protein [Elusimicrobiota bacterium]
MAAPSSRVRIGDWRPGRRVFIIAEVGSNHNGDFAIAQKLVEAAAAAGADAVKFQHYHADRLVHRDQPALPHVQRFHRTQRERFRSLEFTNAQWAELAGLAKTRGIIFFASVFDEASADAMDPLMPAFKIASGDLTHRPLLRHVAAKGKPVVLSTGMATVDEIQDALAVVAAEQVVILHCVSRYPTPAEDANLRSIPFLAERLQVPIGYSDHTVGITACVAAAALGAVMLEKHFTFDKNQAIGDHKLSVEPAELAELVTRVREVERMLGVSAKAPGEAEQTMRTAMRRSLYACRDIPAGTPLTASDVVVLRPATGLPPAALDGLVGRVTKQPIPAAALIEERHF